MLSETQTPRKRGIVSQLKLGKRNDSVRYLGPQKHHHLLGVGEKRLEEVQHRRGSKDSLGGIGKFCSTERRGLRFMSCYNC